MPSLFDNGYYGFGDGDSLQRISEAPLGLDALGMRLYDGQVASDGTISAAMYGESPSMLSTVTDWLKSDTGFNVMSGITTGANAVSGMVTGYYNSAIQSIQREMQARIADFNARQSERQAQAALLQSQQRIGQISQEYESRKASQKASMAANGVLLGVGSAAEVTASTDINKTISINNEYVNGYMNAWNARMQGVSYSLTADGARSSGPATSWGAAVEGLTTGIAKGTRDYLYSRRNNSYGVVI